jgi:regulator of cell morphogenesis and NO signaling
MKIENLSLSEIVTQKPQAAAIFESYSLDFCCKGKFKLSDVVTDPDKLHEIVNVLEIIYSDPVNNAEIDFDSMRLSDLVEYIISIHHQYVKDIVPVIRQHVDKVVAKHGENFPFMIKVRSLFNRVADDLISHMMKEELILFPRIKSMESILDEGDAAVRVALENPIRIMEQEHELAGELMAEIKKLSNNYQPVENACMTHRVCLEELRMFEIDLHKHVHLENNILFPKALKLEQSLIAK